MATNTPQPGGNGNEPGGSTGITLHTSLSGTQHQLRQQVVHHNAANAANKNMTEKPDLKTTWKTGSSRNKIQHAIGCKYIHIMVNES
jgi:hypothetical protein